MANAYCNLSFPLTQVADMAAKVHVPEFVPKKGVQIETDPKVSC